MNRVELIMRRRAVGEFIRADPVEVIITRPGELIETAAGGSVRGASSPLAPQQFRIVQNRRRYDNGLVNSEAGAIPHTDYLLIGIHTTDVQVDDEFEWRDNFWRVTGIHPTRTESKLCSIDFLGPRNGE